MKQIKTFDEFFSYKKPSMSNKVQIQTIQEEIRFLGSKIVRTYINMKLKKVQLFVSIETMQFIVLLIIGICISIWVNL